MKRESVTTDREHATDTDPNMTESKKNALSLACYDEFP